MKLCLAGAVKLLTCNDVKMRSELVPHCTHQRLMCGVSRVGVGHGALSLRVGQMRCSIGGVGVGHRMMLPRVGGLHCSVGRDDSCRWALLPGSGGTWRNVGRNSAGQGVTLLFVGSASYGIGINRGASRGIGCLSALWHVTTVMQHDIEMACACTQGLVVVAVVWRDV